MNDTLGIILAGVEDTTQLGELTRMRSVAAMPVGGRYRLIDFLLSSMVNSGITNVGVPTLTSYRSLMDHLGSGKEWDLNRKLYGLFVLPPDMNVKHMDAFRGDLDVLGGIPGYLSRSKQEYVMLCGCSALFNTTFYDLREQHILSGADVSVMCCPCTADVSGNGSRLVAVTADDDGTVTDMRARSGIRAGELRSMDIWFMKKRFLEQQIERCLSHGMHDFIIDVVIRNLDRLKIHAYRYDGHVGLFDSAAGFYCENMRFLEPAVCAELFPPDNPVYTKIKDQIPTFYGEHAAVSNAIVGDGCVVKGTVENCVIFRGVTIEEGAHVRDSIVMQNSHIESGAELECAILDKNVTIRPGKRLVGQPDYPVVVGKNTVI